MAEETIRPEFLDSYRIVTNGRMFRVQRQYEQREDSFWRWLWRQPPEYKWFPVEEDFGEPLERIEEFLTLPEAQKYLEQTAMRTQREHDNQDPPWVPVET